MRLSVTSVLLFSVGLLIFAGTGAAQTPAGNEPPQPPPAQQSQDQQQGPNTEVHREFRTGMMPPDVIRKMGPMVRVQAMQDHGPELGGAIRVFSRMEAELDNPMVRTALGLTDQQADSLRKLVVNTEISTIQTGAGIAVDGIQLKELLREDHPDRAAVMAKGDEISKSVSQLVDRYLDAILSAKTILTPEQQKMIRMYIENGGGGAFRAPRARP